MILNLQYYQADLVQAMALARLIADLEPNKRSDYTMLFTARFDTEFDRDTIAYCSHKFRIDTCKTTRRATGWPDGPNQMMGESYQYVVNKYSNRPNMDPHNCVLLFEPDCVPLSVGWKDQLVEEFLREKKMVSGAWLEHGDAGSRHINGNCIVSLEFGKQCPMMFHPPHRGGWDAILAPHILPHAHPSALIWSDYRHGTPDSPWRDCDYLFDWKAYGSPKSPRFGQKLHPVLFHGIKTMAGLECARKRLLG